MGSFESAKKKKGKEKEGVFARVSLVFELVDYIDDKAWVAGFYDNDDNGSCF